VGKWFVFVRSAEAMHMLWLACTCTLQKHDAVIAVLVPPHSFQANKANINLQVAQI
jgi:hypothetical protein